MSLTFKASGFQAVPAVPVDVQFRWSGFLERGRPRPLKPAAYANTTRFGLA